MAMVYKLSSFSNAIKTVLFFLICFALSCKTNKKISMDGPPPIRKQAEVLTALNKHNFDYTFFSVKASADFEYFDMQGSGSVQIRVKKDSLVWMIGKKIGIEGFRSIINKDSFFTVNRIDHSYMAEPNDDIAALFGINVPFNFIQEMMVGNIILPQSSDMITYSQNMEECQVKFNTDSYNFTYTVDARSLNLKKIQLFDRYNNSILILLDDYKKLNKLMLPYTRKYYFSNNNRNVGKLEFEASEIELNIEKSLIFDLPLHYDRINIE
jgi:hypothetical protein